MRMMRRLLCWSAGLAMSAAVGMAAAADKPVITIGYVDGWSDSVATTHVAAEVIREKLGYEVKLMPVVRAGQPRVATQRNSSCACSAH